MLTDGDVFARAQTDPSAFMTIFERHYARISRYLCRRLPATAAEDLAAETFLRAFAARARFDAARPDALPFLYGIATNLLRRHRRDEARMLQAYARSVGPARPPATAESADDADIAAALAELRQEERDVLLLHAWADLEYAEIAEALDIPIGTVRSRLSRARARLRERLAPTARPEEAVNG